MIRDVTLCNVFCNLSRNLSSGSWYLFLNSEFLLAARRKYCETSCKRDLLHCAMARKCIAALRKSLRKVEPDSTSCSSCNKNFA